ncbi:uncharacterized protein [Diabrotica undecimpunctata]|uniref:uncharacterized protein n=1 Tax=Diabrotica undecimpunctata TaxID=50387 RepID=UPI003B632D20
MEDLKKKRKPLKAKITRIANWLLENADAETEGLQFQLRHTELKTCYLKYEDVMDQIEEIDETDSETEDRVLMEEKYFSTLAGLQHKMEALKLPSHSLISNDTPPTVVTAKVRLPEITMQERFNFVKGKKLCWNCLGNKHFSQDCNSSRSCSICKKRHHSLLHSTSENVSSSRNTNRQSFSIDRNAQAPKHSQGSSSRVAHTSTPPSYNAHTQNEASTSSFIPPLEVQNTADSNTATSLSALSVKTDVLLATALVTVYSKDGRPMHARALLDNGSQHSFISRDLVEKLNLTLYFKQLHISTISENTSMSNQMINIEFFPYNVKDRSFKTSFAVLDSITCRLPKATLDRSKIKVPLNLTLADPSYSVPGKIDLLLAGDIYSELLTDEFIRLGKNRPILQNTHLGYVIFGTIFPHIFHRSSNLAISQPNVSLFVQSESEENNLDKLIQQFFEIEEVPHVSKLTPDEELAEQIFNKTTRILPSGRFQMYRQVKINPDQTFLLNILWRDFPEKDIECLELQTVTYGTKSASFQSTRCLMELANTHQTEYPLASDALQNNCYIDDILYGANDEQTLLKAHKEITSLLVTACISLHKWCSNSDSFLKNISSLSSNSSYVIAPDNCSNKVLFLCWNPVLDTFSISLRDFTLNNSYTKREVLSMIAQIFYPQGLINPVTVVAKLIMQKIWISKISWNDTIDADALHEWLSFISSLSHFKDLSIPRCLFLSQEITGVEIHSFSDASLKAYGACIYLRVIYKSEQVSCSLLASKSRVAPLKPLTLPRLELMGALLCSKLTAKIANIVKEKLSQLDSINMWSDSEIVLAWLRSHPSRWTQFVANRVAQILDNSPNAHWRHVRSKENPADILSRGMLPSEIINSSLWFHGPPFLNQLRLDLLKYNPKGYISKFPEERKIILHARNDQIDFFTSLFDRFSNFSKFVRTLAYMFRFANNAKPLSRKLTDTLEVSELQNAELKIIKMLQYSNFSSEISELKKGKTLSNKCLLPLNPFLDENEILRVGGRLRNSDVTFDQRYPLLLPSKNRIVRLILHREHVRLCHSGPQNTLSQIRLKYWPLNGLREVKKVTHQCMVCFKFRAKPATQIMADLPKERLNSSRVFAHVGLDFGGPFQIKASNLRKAPLLKSYIALFVCLSTRAVHIEVVSGLSTKTFLLAIKRFISRRGLPQTIFSDNATNFLGARNQLFELYKFFKEKESSRSIKEFLASSHIRWKTIVPRAPYHDGIWESAIKSAKHHMRRLLGNVKLTFEEFTIVLVQIEAVLHSRPLCSLSNDPSDFTYLTPGHFLIGQSLTSFPEKDVIHIPENRLNLWQHLSKLQQVFWKKWSIDYLNRLQNRPKWFLPHKNLEPSDLVLLIEDNTPPLHWVLARVIEVFPGKDGRGVCAIKFLEGPPWIKLTPIGRQDKVWLKPKKNRRCD